MFNYFDREQIEKFYPNAYMIPPMLAWSIPSASRSTIQKNALEDPTYVAQPKIDGVCCMFEHTPKGEAYLFTRTKSVKTGLLVEKSKRVPHLQAALKKSFPRGTVLALEIYHGELHTTNSYAVTSILNSDPIPAIEKQLAEGPLKAFIHDILIYGNRSYMDSFLINRYKMLQAVRERYEIEHELFCFAPMVIDNKQDYLKRCQDMGMEGLILKRENSPYVPGKRPSKVWIKIKPVGTYDVICLGFNKPTREYKGSHKDTWRYRDKDGTLVTKHYYHKWPGSMSVGCYRQGEIIKVGQVKSGLSEEVLHVIAKDVDSYIHKPVLIEAMDVTKDFKFREPRFLRFRDDINPEDCTFEKIFT